MFVTPLVLLYIPYARVCCVLHFSCKHIVACSHQAVYLQVISSMEELYKFMNHSNATLDLKVGSELITEAPEEGAEPLEVQIC